MALAKISKPIRTYVVFAASGLSNETLTNSELWETANRMPQVIVIKDEDGAVSKAFDARTSGQVFLYDSDGKLRFHGGITASRGHAGDNIGRSAVESLTNTGRCDTTTAPVFGCSLY
jgi:hypothetical protein